MIVVAGLPMFIVKAVPVRYGVRPRETCTLRDQLGLVPGTKSKIADRSDMGALWRHVTTVGDS